MSACEKADTAATRLGSYDQPLRVYAVLIVLESALLGAALLLHAPPLLWLVCHLLIVACLAVSVARQRRFNHDLSSATLMLLSLLVAGPVGATFALIAIWHMQTYHTQPALLSAWYERIALAGDIDPVTRLANTVAMGRSVGTSQVAPRAFAEVMSTGALADRQTALGLIARQFSPAYARALKSALVGGEPVIRVQAAAVAVKVRSQLMALAKKEMNEASALGPREAHACIAASQRLYALAQTGLLEDDDAAAADRCVARLVADGLANGLPSGLDAPARQHVESVLLRSGQFSIFRAVRDENAHGVGSAEGRVVGDV